MEFLHPGVFVQEVSGGVQPIEGVSTSTTGFIGKAAQGQLNVAQMVTSFTAFQSQYGGFLTDGYLAHAALAFFNNGRPATLCGAGGSQRHHRIGDPG